MRSSRCIDSRPRNPVLLSSLFQYSRIAFESFLYGPAYAMVRNLIDHPEPHEPEKLWSLINSNQGRWIADNYPPKFIRRMLIAGKMRQDHKSGIAEHYDVSNDFYKLFLDEKFMFYSCADFHSPSESLEEAQTHKANFLADLIDPQPGEKILDLGCGWGPMLRHLNERTGDKSNLYGYTLSEEQIRHNDEHNGFNVELKNFVTSDYPSEFFDKIYSIGSWEHVRLADLDKVTPKLFDALKPKGRLIKHFICPLDGGLTNDVVVAQLFFPGSYIPGYPTQMKTFEKAGFKVTHQSIHDYRPTLRAWFDNLVANKEAAIEMVGLGTYNRYLVFFACSHNYFERRQAILFRAVFEKP